MKRQITIVGCGVSGMTTAIRLQQEGYEVKIITKDYPENSTSNRAAAFWFPYHVRDTAEILEWSMLSYRKFEELSLSSETGVHMVPVFKLGNEVNEIEKRIKQTLPPDYFRPLLKEECKGNFSGGWRIMVPLIETPVYLPFLLRKFLNDGGRVVHMQVHSLMDLAGEGQMVINCSGLGSRALAGDESLIPIRGQIAFLRTKNKKQIILEDTAPTYIVYRSDGCICGGTYEENIFSAQTSQEAIAAILERCCELENDLKSAPLIDCWAGLRPYRSRIRVEYDAVKNIIHNYGHGGSGFTVSWGCAEEVVKLVKELP